MERTADAVRIFVPGWTWSGFFSSGRGRPHCDLPADPPSDWIPSLVFMGFRPPRREGDGIHAAALFFCPPGHLRGRAVWSTLSDELSSVAGVRHLVLQRSVESGSIFP